MKLGLKMFLAIFFISIVSFFTLIYYSTTGTKLPAISLQAAKGKLLFQRKSCIECHTVFGNGGYSGGDLTKVYGKFGKAGLKDYLTQPSIIQGAKHKRHDQLTGEESDDVIEYLAFIFSIDTNNWPPQPFYNTNGQVEGQPRSKKEL
ncbi:cytochrome c [bacterium BFN5]|nr:cytochrome c [bacterium BFN5]